jgi:ADP-dependent NAD(P)H-hydrate dehydratase / NAD(P)H-hydrate epimerase
VWSGPPLRTGASRLSAQAALAVGAGLVTIIGELAALAEQAAHVTAIMLREADADLRVIDDRVTALAVGPGAGNDIGETVFRLLGPGVPTVLDADALTAFEANSGSLFNVVDANDVMTPHAGEFARLFPDIALEDRKRAASLAAQRAGAVVLLKGPETHVAAPDGRTAINLHASPWLATAGSGDVLTGLICGLLAQGTPAFDAACIGAWLHGDIGVRAGAGLTADGMVGHIPLVLQGCLEDAAANGAGSRA